MVLYPFPFGHISSGHNVLRILEEAFLDVELFGHASAPDRLLDGTVGYPGASGIVRRLAVERGAAAA